MGRRVVISGTVDIDPSRTCAFADAVWPCGQRARAAFNAWMRGRALKCFLPPDGDRFTIAAPCTLGRQDVGAWLVANGWAMASPSGIYGKAESVARDAEMGIFGPPQYASRSQLRKNGMAKRVPRSYLTLFRRPNQIIEAKPGPQPSGASREKESDFLQIVGLAETEIVTHGL